MLKELTAEGEASFEIHACMKPRPGVPGGEAVFEVETSVIVPIGFKSYTFPVRMAVHLKGIEGDIAVKVKPPPSNRLWWAFTKAPKIDWELKPVISSRQIQMGIIVRTLETYMLSAVSHPSYYRSKEAHLSDERYSRTAKYGRCSFL